MDSLLKVENLQIKTLENLKELNFQVFPSEIVGIYSKVDSGQELIIDVLTGLQRKKSGNISMVENFYAINHDSAIYEDMTIEENLEFTKEVYSTNVNISEILEKIALKKHKDTLVGKLPLALRKMSQMATVLTTDFELLILEEPSMGLDDDSNIKLIEIAEELKKEGKGVLIFTSRKIDLNYCDRVITLEEIGD
jgi:ABC-type multidrug transport system ATPase subunit